RNSVDVESVDTCTHAKEGAITISEAGLNNFVDEVLRFRTTIIYIASERAGTLDTSNPNFFFFLGSDTPSLLF
ncbi:hypothetical protein ACJX0J_038900, partial [Zea mays]